MTDFEEKVLDALTELKVGMGDLKTKMGILVGPDGTGGWKADTEERVQSLEETRSNQRGFVAAVTAGGSAVGVLLGALLQWLIGRH